MIWKNQSHEFDEMILNEGVPAIKNGVFVFGTGKIGKQIGDLFLWLGILRGFIDNSSKKQGELLLDKEIMSLEKIITYYKKFTIVVAMNKKNQEQVDSQLKKYNMRKGIDYFFYESFIMSILPVGYMYENDKLFMNMCQLSITERCTLRCVKCAHGCGYNRENAKDMELDSIVDSANNIFKYVDKVRYFQIIGGEPLMNNHLIEAVDFIGKNYRNKIFEFSIVSNGSLIPTDEVCDFCKKYDVSFRISNYSNSIPQIVHTHKKLIEKLERYNIKYLYYNIDKTWVDYGFDHVDHGWEIEMLQKVFNTCETQCHEIRNNHFYYCIQARATRDNMGFSVGEMDFLDLDNLPHNRAKYVLLEYSMGYSDKGYLDMCNYCNGVDANNYPIPVAEQMK